MKVILLSLLLTLLTCAAEPRKQEAKVAEVPVTVWPDAREKGILLHLPKGFSATHQGEKVSFSYGVTNTLEEPIFLKTEPVDFVYAVYRHADGSRGKGVATATLGPHFDRYALLAGSTYETGERISTCCSASTLEAKITLPAFAKTGGTLEMRIVVYGYFKKTGERFRGEVEVTLPVVE